MNCAKKENLACTMADSEELDYEDDVSVKKFSPVTFENEKDVEEGEISDVDGESFLCAAYQSGRCYAGDNCPFFHVTDKGLYKMFDAPRSSELQDVHLGCDMWEEETAWEKALLKAKRLVKERDSRVNRTCNPVIITVGSDQEPVSRPKPRRYRSPETLPYKSSLSDSLNDSLKRKSIEHQHEWCRKVKWHDPWRRSAVDYSKSSVVSSTFRRRKLSTSSSSSDCRIRFKDRSRMKNTENQRKMKSSRFFPRSCSPTSTRQSGKEKFKTENKMKKVIPSVKEKKPSNIDKSKKSTKIAREEKKIQSSIDNKPFLKPTEIVKKETSPFVYNSDRPFSASQWTPKNRQPPASDSKFSTTDHTSVQSCSDMSISPLSDSSLSDFFDPDKKIDRALRASRPRSFEVRKTCLTKASSTIAPPKSQVANLFQMESMLIQNDEFRNPMNSAEVKPTKTTPSEAATVNNGIAPSKLKAVKKEITDGLMGELLKFQYRPSLGPSWPTPTKSVVSKHIVKSTENSSPKEDGLLQSEKVKEAKKDRKPQEAPLTRKEVLLKQLEAINAAIERKKNTTPLN